MGVRWGSDLLPQFSEWTTRLINIVGLHPHFLLICLLLTRHFSFSPVSILFAHEPTPLPSARLCLVRKIPSHNHLACSHYLESFISCMYFGVRFASFLYLDPTEFRLNFQLGNLRIMTFLGGFPNLWRCDLDEVPILMLFMLHKDGGIGRSPWRKQVGTI